MHRPAGKSWRQIQKQDGAGLGHVVAFADHHGAGRRTRQHVQGMGVQAARLRQRQRRGHEGRKLDGGDALVALVRHQQVFAVGREVRKHGDAADLDHARGIHLALDRVVGAHVSRLVVRDPDRAIGVHGQRVRRIRRIARRAGRRADLELAHLRLRRTANIEDRQLIGLRAGDVQPRRIRREPHAVRRGTDRRLRQHL